MNETRLKRIIPILLIMSLCTHASYAKKTKTSESAENTNQSIKEIKIEQDTLAADTPASTKANLSPGALKISSKFKKKTKPIKKTSGKELQADFSAVTANTQDTESKNKTPLEEANEEMASIVTKKREKKEQWIDTINFIQPSAESDLDKQGKVDQLLSRAEQEQLLILWRATLERNKTIRFIVQKLAPDNANKKRNQVLSQVLNTAIFLPFYAIQTVAPADTSALASSLGAGVASDIINGSSKRNKDKLILTQTEMVIMFMMIDNIAERVRDEYRRYKMELIDSLLAKYEIEESKKEAAASLDTDSPEAQFLAQIRIRQLERESRRIDARLRSHRITLLDLSGSPAVAEVDKLIQKEFDTLLLTKN